MSIAKKLTAIAENEQKVYDAGYAAGQAAGGGGDDTARGAEYIRFCNWNFFGKPEAEVTIYNMTGWGSIFADGTYPQNDTVEHLTVNSPIQPTTLNNCFNDSKSRDVTLKRLTLNVDLSQCTDFGNAFRGRPVLEVIDGTPIDFSAATTIGPYVCYLCRGLKELRVKPSSIHVSLGFATSQNLSTETLQSLIDGLADLTGQDTQTLTLSETSARSLTETQKAAITAKNWTLVG